MRPSSIKCTSRQYGHGNVTSYYEWADWLIDAIHKIDFSQSYLGREIQLRNAYDKLLGLNQAITPAEKKAKVFGCASYDPNEFRTGGGLRSYLHVRYATLNIKKNYGLNIREWLSQPMNIISQQITDLDEITTTLEELAKKLKLDPNPFELDD